MRKYMPIIAAVVCAALISGCGASPSEASSSPAAVQTEEPTPTPSPTPEPTPTPNPTVQRAEEILSGMTLRDKLCQLMVIRPEALGGEQPTTSADEAALAALAEYPVGGFVFTLDNLETVEQTLGMINGFQGASEIGLLICADEEGGNVARLMYKLGTTWFNSMYSYRSEGASTAYGNALTIGGDMLSCGFNTDFAPVADVWTNPSNTVIGTRAYSDDYSEASELVSAAVGGFRDSGVICTLKHFPGHGDTSADTHTGAAIVTKSLDELRAGELLPFVAGINAGADMVMMGHMTVTALDADNPASMSYAVVTGLLRGELGYDGVIITDALEMGALADMSEGEKCLRCLRAGVDIVLAPSDLAETVVYLEQAVADGELDASQIDASVMRVLIMKLGHGVAQ